MQNAIYTGFVIHNRIAPKLHKFQYKMRMFFLDIDEVQHAFKGIPFISFNKFNLISFNTKNYFPYKNTNNIRAGVEAAITKNGFQEMPKRIFILTNLAYFGFCYNPVSFYYCYNDSGELMYFLSEVNNTPWNERYVYVKKIEREGVNCWAHKKEFHVSPFLPMNMQYSWKMSKTHDQIRISLSCIDAQAVFRATLKLFRTKMDLINCFTLLILSPLTTFIIVFRIYWQALGLFIKRIPFYPHTFGHK